MFVGTKSALPTPSLPEGSGKASDLASSDLIVQAVVGVYVVVDAAVSAVSDSTAKPVVVSKVNPFAALFASAAGPAAEPATGLTATATAEPLATATAVPQATSAESADNTSPSGFSETAPLLHDPQQHTPSGGRLVVFCVDYCCKCRIVHFISLRL